MPGNKPRNQYKKKRKHFHGVRPQENSRTTESDMVKESNMAASLSSFPKLVTLTSIFMLEVMLKTVIMLAKEK